MKTKFFLSILTLILGLSLKAQPTKPTEVLYDSLHQGIQATAICPAIDGGYIISGVSNYGNSGLIIKVDTGGNVIWNTFFSHYNSITVYNIIAVDSSYIIAGSAKDSAFNYTLGLLLKVDKTGHVIWAKTYKNPSGGITLTSVQPTNDSGFVFCGYQSLTGSTPNYQAFVTKTDQVGNMLWHKLFGDAGYGTKLSSIKQLPDSSFVVLGFLESAPIKPILTSLSKSGSLNWTKMYTLTSGGNSYGNDLIVSKHGLILNISAGNNSSLLKTDFLGNQIWSKFYPNSSSQQNAPYVNQTLPSRVHQSIDSGYYFTANSFSSFFYKTDSTGTLQFIEQLVYSSSADALQSIDKGFLITGNGPGIGERLASNSPNNAPQIGLVKVDSIGHSTFCSYPGGNNMSTDAFSTLSISFTSSTGVTQSSVLLHTQQLVIEVMVGCIQFTGGIESYTNNVEVDFYPNPTSNYLTINSTTELGAIALYNSLGQKMTQTQSKETTTQMDISSLPAGIYTIAVKGRYLKLIKG